MLNQQRSDIPRRFDVCDIPMHQHHASRTVEENDDLAGDRCRAGDALVSQCFGKPSLEPLFVRGTRLNCGMSRSIGKLGRRSHEAAAPPAWLRCLATEGREQTTDLL